MTQFVVMMSHGCMSRWIELDDVKCLLASADPRIPSARRSVPHHIAHQGTPASCGVASVQLVCKRGHLGTKHASNALSKLQNFAKLFTSS